MKKLEVTKNQKVNWGKVRKLRQTTTWSKSWIAIQMGVTKDVMIKGCRKLGIK